MVMAIFAMFSLFCSQTAFAEAYAISCYTTGSLGSSRYVIHVNDPLIQNITNPRITMTEPPYGIMNVLEVNDVRLVISVEHGVPKFPHAMLTLIINRDTGAASIFATKTQVHEPIKLFWIEDENILGKDEGACNKFVPKL
jgi:hypothetical protein